MSPITSEIVHATVNSAMGIFGIAISAIGIQAYKDNTNCKDGSDYKNDNPKKYNFLIVILSLMCVYVVYIITKCIMDIVAIKKRRL